MAKRPVVWVLENRSRAGLEISETVIIPNQTCFVMNPSDREIYLQVFENSEVAVYNYYIPISFLRAEVNEQYNTFLLDPNTNPNLDSSFQWVDGVSYSCFSRTDNIYEGLNISSY